MKKIFFYLLILSIFSISCEKYEPTIYRDGYFTLTQLQSSDLKSLKSDSIITDSIKTEFKLGDLKASKEFYFILSNGSNHSIFDVTFESTNPAFKVYPEKITELPSSRTNQNMIPLISVNAIHGTRLNGVGYTDLMPMNMNYSEIKITGKIVEHCDTILVQSTFKFSVNAKIMDVTISNNNSEIDLTNSGTIVCSMGTFRGYELPTPNITIKNIGNVDINYSIYTDKNATGKYEKGTTQQIKVNESKDLQLSYFSMVELESDGTITDGNRIKLDENGNGFFAILPK